MGDGKMFNNNKPEDKAPVEETKKAEEPKGFKATKPTQKKVDGKYVTDKWGNPTFF